MADLAFLLEDRRHVFGECRRPAQLAPADWPDSSGRYDRKRQHRTARQRHAKRSSFVARSSTCSFDVMAVALPRSGSSWLSRPSLSRIRSTSSTARARHRPRRTRRWRARARCIRPAHRTSRSWSPGPGSGGATRRRIERHSARPLMLEPGQRDWRRHRGRRPPRSSRLAVVAHPARSIASGWPTRRGQRTGGDADRPAAFRRRSHRSFNAGGVLPDPASPSSASICQFGLQLAGNRVGTSRDSFSVHDDLFLWPKSAGTLTANTPQCRPG